jgi:alpha-methylacyl-CoA racemase
LYVNIRFEDGAEHGALFESLNAGKKNIVLDLKKVQGSGVLKRLINTFDIIIEGNRPGVMDRLGIGFSDLIKHNDRLIYCSISGYGSTGPYAMRAGHDVNYMSIAGLIGLSGQEGTTPPLPGFQAADAAGAMQAVIGIQSALIERATTGKGQFVDVSLCEAAMTLALPGLVGGALHSVAKRGEGMLDGGLKNYSIYKTKDDRYVALGALESNFFINLCTHLNISPKIDTQGLINLFSSKTRDEWVAISDQCDACLEPVLSTQEILHHPQHVAREVFLDPNNSQLPKQFRIGPKLSNHSAKLLRRAANVGEDTVSVMKSSGFNDNEINELLDAKIICK